MTDTSISINKIFLDAISNNKLIIVPSITYLIGHYLQDVVFTKAVANVTADVPTFIADVDILKLFYLLLPYLVALILLYISDILAAKTLPKIELDAINSLTDQMMESFKTTKNAPNVGEMILHLKKISDTKRIYDMIFTYLIPTLFVIGILIYNVIKGNVQIGMIVILTVLMLIGVTITIEYDIMESVVKNEENLDELYEDILDVMDNIDTVITSNMKDNEMMTIANKSNEIYEIAYSSDIKKYSGTYSVLVLTLVAVVVINYFSYNLYRSGQIDTVTLVANVLLSVLFMDYYGYTINALMTLMTDFGRINEIGKYFSKYEIKKELPDKGTLKISNGDVLFKDIDLKYGKKVIFSKSNFNIKGGKITGIVGPIGTGKSSLLKMLSGIIDYEGDISIDSQNLNDISHKSITDNVAYISQHPHLFDRTILENITYGTEFSEKDVMRIAKQLGLESFFDQFPLKLKTNVGKGGSNLSGGQKQFVSLIRATLQNKKILLLDEPTSSLDEKSKFLLMDILKKLKNKTIIVVTHDKDLNQIFDTTIKLSRR